MPMFNERILQLYKGLVDLNVKKFGRKDLAAYLGVTIGQVNGWLDDKGRPDYETLIQISTKTGISVLWFIGMSDDMYHIPTNTDDIGLPAEAEEDFRLLMQFLKFKYRTKQHAD